MSPKNSPDWGGRRDGAGRPKNENAKRALISVRVPEDVAVRCKALGAMDYATDQLSLSELMIRNELSTFFAEATGDSMVDAGICDGDTLILDRSLEPRSGDIVLAFLHGDFTLKRLRIRDGKIELCPENAAADYPVICPGEGDNFSIEGVLTGICRKFRR